MKGFSLLEILVTLAIVSLLALMTLSTYTRWYQQKNLEEAANEFVHALTTAKTLSTLRGETIYVCTSTNQQNCNVNWQGPLIIFMSDDPTKIETPLQQLKPFPADIVLQFSEFKSPPLYFQNNGEVANNASFSLSNGRNTLNFTLSNTGIVSPTT